MCIEKVRIVEDDSDFDDDEEGSRVGVKRKVRSKNDDDIEIPFAFEKLSTSVLFEVGGPPFLCCCFSYKCLSDLF